MEYKFSKMFPVTITWKKINPNLCLDKISSQPAFACWKSTIETQEQCVKFVQSEQFVFIFDFKQISQIVLVFLLLTLNKYTSAGFVPICLF